jgi:hypothetical protein
MYRIEVATGEEAVFRTVEELATGIRNGLITPRSRIFHAASQKWLPIEFHPHYKKAVDLITGGAPMIDTGLTRPPMASARRPTPVPPPAPRRADPPPAPPASPAPPRPAMVHPPKLPSPRSEQHRFAPPHFGPSPLDTPEVEPPTFQAPKAEPPTFAAPAFEPAASERVAVALPPVEVPAVEIPLPRISYPEVDSAGIEVPHPVARRRARGKAPLALGGLVVLAVIGGYVMTSSAARASDSEPPAAVEPEPSPSVHDAPAEPTAELVAEEPPAPSKPAATGLELLEPAPRPTGPVSQAWSSSAGAIAPVPPPAPPSASPGAALPQIAPAPTQLELALPKLPSADTIGARARAARDSVALKRILRAVGGQPGGKPAR